VLPINPCGKIVGQLRSCYETRIYPFRDDLSIWTDIVYYFVPWENGVLPFPTIFCPITWNWNKSYPLPGEDLNLHEYYNGADVWGLNGDHVCGTREQWYNGCLTTDPVPAVLPGTFIPTCCGSPLIPGVCGPFSLIPGIYRVTVSGCSGSKAGFNGTHDVPSIGSCLWELFIPAAGDYIFLALYSTGLSTWELQVFLGLHGDDAQYYEFNPPNVTGPYNATKTVGGILFPPTVNVLGI